tara:strand:+ start:4003 stop:4221 length:219 start_codon:yes stop_codon:yes gene_type:complete
MKKLTLERSWFRYLDAELSDESEFDYVLRELNLGSDDDDRYTIEEIELTLVSAEITEQDHSPIDDDGHKEVA